MTNQQNSPLLTTAGEASETASVVLPAYEAPSVRTFTADELLKTLGPAQAGSVDDAVFG